MNLQRLLSLVIVAAFIYFFTQIVDKLAKKRFEKKNEYDFTLRMNRGYAWLSTFLFLYLIVIFSLVLPDAEPHLVGYLVIGFIMVMLFFYMVKGQVIRLKVKDDNFCFVNIFGRSRKFTLEDITKAKYKSDIFKDDKGKKNAFIILYSGIRWLATVNSHMLGFELLLERLRNEGVFERRFSDFASSLNELIENSMNQSGNDAIRDEIEAIREEMIEINKKHLIEKSAMFDEISLLEMKDAGIAYVQDSDYNEIPMLLFSDSLGQHAKDGIILTSTHLSYRTTMGKLDRIGIIDIEKVSLKKKRLSIVLNIELKEMNMEFDPTHKIDEVQLDAFLRMLNLMIKLLKLLNSQDAPAKLP
jgi:hypothetical protein